MKKSFFILLLLLSSAVNAATYYVSTSGNNNNPGTLAQPFATWNYAFNKLAAGDILYIRGGTYTTMLGNSGGNSFGVRLDSKKGTASSHITISAYNNEVAVLDGSSLTSSSGQNIGIALYNCSYIDFTGLNILNFTAHATNANDAPGFYEYNVSNITHTLCSVHHCGDGFTLWGSHNNIYYTNCDSYENADTFADPSGALPGSLANGFYCSPDPGTHIYYTGCRAWNCSDDGWDFYSGDGYIEMTNCWAFNNGWTDAGGPIQATRGDGSGFKLGPSNTLESGFQRILKNCIASGNLGPGFDVNRGSNTNVRHAFYNCVAANNTKEGFQYYGDALSTIRNTIGFGNGSNPGDLASVATVDHNSWQNGLVISAADFAGTDIAELKSPRKADGSLPDINYMHPVTACKLIDAGVDVGLPYSGKAPDLGAFEFQSGSTAPVPVFVSSSVENAAPNLLSMTYSLTLANIVPLATSFSVKVNSVARNINAVTVSGTKVLLTLGSQVTNSDAISISYTKPAVNPIQTASGGQAASISNQIVTNNVSSAAAPVYVSSAIENATPLALEMTYNLSLSNIVPASAAFNVKVNSVARSVNTVSISGTKVILTLSSPVIYNDVVTVAYTKPTNNPLQTPSGGQAATLSAQSVTNKISNPSTLGYINSAVGNSSPALLEINFNLTLANVLPVPSSFIVRVNSVIRTVNSVSVSGTSVVLALASEVFYGDVVTVAYTKPSTNQLQSTSGLQAATMTAQTVVNKLNSISPVYVSSAIENSTPNVLEIAYNETLDLTVPGVTSFVVMVNGIHRAVTSVVISGNKVLLTLSSYVVYGDVVTVSYIKPSSNQLKKASGEIAVSISPQPVKNNSLMKPVNPEKKVNIIIYPNPAHEFINVSKLEASPEPKIFRIFDFSGRLCSETQINPNISEIRIPLTLKSGVYVVQIAVNSVILTAQQLIVKD